MLTRHQFYRLISMQTSLATLTSSEWNALLRILRTSHLTSTFHYACQSEDIESLVPAQIMQHLCAATRFYEAQNKQVLSASSLINKIAATCQLDIMFLKGAAYACAGKRNAFGRLFSDIDILVTKENLSKLETYLRSSGWVIKKLDDYDDIYYRDWSHELPPYLHLETGVTLDIHHTLLPPISGYEVDLGTLWSTAYRTESGYLVPDTVFMILHSAIHLLLNDDVANGLRDLLDIKCLVEDVDDLRAVRDVFLGSGFEQEYYLMLELLAEVFELPQAKNELLATTQKHTSSFLIKAYLEAISINTHHIAERPNVWMVLAVYVRGHLKKMPLLLFLKHIAYKSFKSFSRKIFGEFVFRK